MTVAELQKIQEVEAEIDGEVPFFTVKQLREVLQDLPDNMIVCAVAKGRKVDIEPVAIDCLGDYSLHITPWDRVMGEDDEEEE